MTKIKSSLVQKSDAIPGNRISILTQKESEQTKAENSSGQFTVAYPYDLAGLSILYDLNAYHKRCCLVKAGVVTRLGFSIYDPSDSKRKEDEKFKVAKEFVENHIEEFHNFQLDHEIFGNGYLEVIRNGSGHPAEVKYIYAKDSSIKIQKGIRYLQENVNGKYINFVPYAYGKKYDKNLLMLNNKRISEYLHLANHNPNSRYYGVPDYTGAIASMYLDESAKTYNTNRFSNPIPDAIIALAGLENDKDLEANIKSFFQANFADASKAGKKTLLLQFQDMVGKIEDHIYVEKMNTEIKDAAFRGMRQDNREEIIASHGLSPRLVGLESMSKLGGGNESKQQLNLVNELVFIPRKNILASMINTLFLGMEIENWKIKFDNFEFTNATDDATWYETMIKNGVITPEYAAQSQGIPLSAVPGYQEDGTPAPPAKITKEDALVSIAKALKQFRLTLEMMKEE